MKVSSSWFSYGVSRATRLFDIPTSCCPSAPFEALLCWKNLIHRPPFPIIVDSLLLTGCLIGLLGLFQNISRPFAGQVTHTAAVKQTLTFKLPERGLPGRRMGSGTR